MMRTKLTLASLAITILIPACGGGGTEVAVVPKDGGTGVATPIISLGPISGLGSVIVNGVKYDDTGARITIEDSDDDGTGLKVGMVVQLKGEINADKITGKAAGIESGAELRGPVESVNVSAKTFVALGTTVKIDASTAFVNVAADLSDLSPGGSVQVSGLLAAGGVVTATRVQKRPPQAQAVLKTVGAVAAAPAPTATSFTLGTLTVNYTASVVRDVAVPIPAGTLVRVKLAGPPVSGVVTATQVRPYVAPLGTPVAGTQAEVEGTVTDLSGDNFKVAGLSARLLPTTTFERGVRTDLANGRAVEVEGTVVAGVIEAAKVKFEDVSGGGNNEYRFEGPVTDFVSVSDFKVKGQRVDARQNPQVSPGGRSVTEIANGVNLEVRGTQIVNDKLIATRVQFK
jgi:Domain of unknown function (DUF5666)